jgi:hypothetical protein
MHQADASMNADATAADIAHVAGTEHAAGGTATHADGGSWFDAHHGSVA